MNIDNIGLIDLDGTVADYDAAMRNELAKIMGPDEKPPTARYVESREEPYMEARRKLVQRQPGFWRSLERIELGFQVVELMRAAAFELHVLTKGPATTPSAWAEKVEWSRAHLPDALVTITSDKSLVYGRVLLDDWPHYFTRWLTVRPRGLVVCVAQPWNLPYGAGEMLEHPQIFRFDGSNEGKLRDLIQRARWRKSGEPL